MRPKASSAPKVLLLGSYNGQDSLGDGCLFESVVDHIKRRLPDAEIVIHLNKTTAVTDRAKQSRGVRAVQGVQSLSWHWRYCLRRIGLPGPLATGVAKASLPLVMFIGVLIPGCRWQRAFADIVKADLVVIFGGTNFSYQWFWRNALYYALTCGLAKLGGAKVVMSAQQLGPMHRSQRVFMRLWSRWWVDDYRVRNAQCVPILAGAIDVDQPLVFDEVFANTQLYPILPRRATPPVAPMVESLSSPPPITRYRVLFNVREENFVDGVCYSQRQIDWFARFIVALSERLSMIVGVSPEWRLFAVSGPGMADDSRTLRELRENVLTARVATDIAVVPRLASANELIALAQQADACLSMSFHGAIFAGMANIPVIPVSDGDYYDYKFADFDRYGDGRPVPVIRPLGRELDEIVGATTAYLLGFNSGNLLERRKLAAQCSDAFYRSVTAPLAALRPSQRGADTTGKLAGSD